MEENETVAEESRGDRSRHPVAHQRCFRIMLNIVPNIMPTIHAHQIGIVDA